jgi:hypothetical protein
VQTGFDINPINRLLPSQKIIKEYTTQEICHLLRYMLIVYDSLSVPCILTNSELLSKLYIVLNDLFDSTYIFFIFVIYFYGAKKRCF